MGEIKYAEGYHQMTFDEYLQAKEEIRQRLTNMAEDYIYIGYKLRQIQEAESYRQDGYKTLAEFAKAEYGLSESNTSRFIEINKQFSINGGSEKLLPELTGFGSSKLAEMLNLSEEDRELVKQGTTVATIRELKKFNREETLQADIVGRQPAQLQEQPGEEQKEPEKDIQKAIIAFFREEKNLLNAVWNMLPDKIEEIAETINPSGNKTFRKGLYMLFFYGYAEGVALKVFGKQNKKMSWNEFTDEIEDTYILHCSDPKKGMWENYYGKTEEKLVEDWHSEDFSSCDVARREESGKNGGKASEINKNSEQVEGQREIGEYFTQDGNYREPDDTLEKMEELAEKTQKAAEEAKRAAEHSHMAAEHAQDMAVTAAQGAVQAERAAENADMSAGKIKRRVITVREIDNGVMVCDNGCRIAEESCFDEVSSILLKLIYDSVSKGHEVTITFTEN